MQYTQPLLMLYFAEKVEVNQKYYSLRNKGLK
jgi:hypothetical protein